MKNWILTLTLTAASPALADTPLSFLTPKGRIAIGYGQGFVKDDLKPESIQDLDRTRAYWFEVETDTLLALTFGMRFAYDDSTNITFADAGLKRGEIYLTTAQLGLKINIPLGFLRPYAGGGVMGGHLAVSNPDNRPTQGFGVPWSRETSGIRAFYLHAGIDVCFSSEFGIRLGYQRDVIETNRFGNLGNTGVDLTHETALAGFVFSGK